MSAHRHYNDGPCTEIGPDVCLQPLFHGDDEHLAGFFVCFDPVNEDGFRDTGAVNVDPHFAGERPIWQMTGSLEGGDLTLTPSVLMRSAGKGDPERHGFITNGKWVLP